MRKSDFSTYTLLVTYFMASVGFLATALVAAIELPFIFIMSGAAILTLVLNIKAKELLNGFIWNILAVAVFAVFIIRYAFTSGSIIATLAMLLTVLLVLKLFDLKRNRDYLQVYGIVFFQVLAAAASTISPFFFLVLSLFITGGIWAMVIFNMKRDFSTAFPADEDLRMFAPGLAFGTKFFLSIVAISFISMFMATLLFFILPRIGAGFFERRAADVIKVTGFSKDMDLAALGPLKKDSTVVMRVEMNVLPGRTVYFRGNSFDHYDGKRWSKKIKGEVYLKRNPRGAFSISGKPAKGSDLIKQKILLEPLDTDVLFAASRALYIRGNFSGIWVDKSGSIRLPSPEYSRIEYNVVSDLSGAEPAPDRVRPEYMDTSYIERDPSGARIKALAAEITRHANTTAGKARAIDKYLKTHYSYTLDTAKNGEIRPLDDFLFHSKAGFCEHFATAMVMLLRVSGVPARIVTGFTQGEWNGLGNYFIIRQEDAHSWVEAYIGRSGWTTFDPTPPAGLVPYTRPSRIALYLDLVRWKWDRYVIRFSFADQKRMAAGAEKGTSSFLNSVRRYFRRPKSKTHAPEVVAVAVLAGLFFYLALRKNASHGKSPKMPRFYVEMEKILRKKGFSRTPGETPMEFAVRTDMNEAREITEAFQMVRYGGGALDKDDLIRVRKAIERLEANKT